MKTNAYFNKLRDNSLAGKLTKNVADMTDEFKFVLPHGWRFIAKIATLTDNGTPPQQLFYLDLQASEGGGSWAEAKLQTMEMMNLAATQPLLAGRIRNWILDAGLKNTKYGKEVYEVCDAVYDDLRHKGDDTLDTKQLSKKALQWLVNVKNGPGIAPNFGGLQVATKCHFFEEKETAALNGSNWKAVAETDLISVSFSGAAAWQDLQFATCALGCIIEHFRDIPDEAFEFNFEPLKEIPEVHFWLKNYGLA